MGISREPVASMPHAAIVADDPLSAPHRNTTAPLIAPAGGTRT